MLSKRAENIDQLKKVIFSLWNANRGPFENILGLLTNVIPFIAGLGWVAFGIEKVADVFGFGLSDFGEWIDKKLNLTPTSKIDESITDNLVELFKSNVNQPQSRTNKPTNSTIPAIATYSKSMQKTALWGGVFGLLGGFGSVAKLLYTAVKLVCLAIGVESVKDIYEKSKQYNVSGLVSTITTPEKNDTISFDPTKLVNLF